MEKFFKIKEKGSTVSREVVGGITTFLAMSYILAVNPGMLGSIAGMNFGGVFTATAVSAAVATLIMAFLANMPVALASGMGLNAFFTYTVCGQMGCSPWFALTAVLLEGVLFILLSFFGVREAIINSIPGTMKKAVAVGIGLFIALIGLNNAGIVTSANGTIIGFNAIDLSHATALVAIIGLVITVVLYILKVPGAILIGIAATTVIGIPFGVTTVPDNFKPVSVPSAPFLFKFEWAGVLSLKFFGVFFTFLFTDIFDTIGTLMGVAEQGNLVDEKGNIPNVKGALLADAVGTVAGACLGTSTVTSFVESSSGVAAGARTGLASVVTAFFFLLALFFTPLFALVPSCATAPALIFVGFLMMQAVSKINFADITDGIPAFITIMVMPFGYSISKGIAFGMIAYVIAKIAGKKTKEIPVVTWILAVVFIFALAIKAI
ncbi:MULTISPECIES: NCS2 family permease [Treponema]|uniref:Xanthine/uracil/vitamin C permease n=1 Tax=Treponema succinifaciens (strain ATCC 33096 / DSM 2489 / 6091) TaxID=869209 RepID=F2NSP5_TRES6|nr:MULTISPECIES: NCS2 family permease [Treponema]AEB14283.1 Xanthine/uracil/vitamin C permease [Treponema succinifaciens DSM 2489]MDD6961690.1 NCS2 family permease [Treponema succinifaciens]MDY5117702.1 NCS2 family permease [Treponema succinifaciens]